MGSRKTKSATTTICQYSARRKRRKLKLFPSWPLLLLTIFSLGFLPSTRALLINSNSALAGNSGDSHFTPKSTAGFSTETTTELHKGNGHSHNHHHQRNKISIPKHAGKPHRTALHDSIVISGSLDQEQEARKLYDEALKEFGVTGKTIKEICKPWELKGCHCSGKMEEVTLVCRGVSFNVVPFDLPDDLIKL